MEGMVPERERSRGMMEETDQGCNPSPTRVRLDNPGPLFPSVP